MCPLTTPDLDLGLSDWSFEFKIVITGDNNIMYNFTVVV